MPVKTVSSQSKSCDKCKGEWIGNDALVTQHAPRRVCQPLVITSRWKPLPESTTSTLLWEEAFISKSLHNTTLNLFCNAVRCCSGFRLDVAGLPMKLLKKCSHTYTMTDMEKEHIVARWCAKSLHITHCYVWSMNPLPDYDPSNANSSSGKHSLFIQCHLYIVFVSFDGASAGQMDGFFVSFDSCDYQLRHNVCSKERLKWIVVALNIASAIGVAFN